MKNTLYILWKSIISDPSVHTYLNKEKIKWSFMIELSRWKEGFYERFIGITKMPFRKIIVKLSSTYSQPQTVLSLVEAILNARPFVHAHNGLKLREITTPVLFYGSKS